MKNLKLKEHISELPKYPSGIILIIVNLLPIYGVLFLGWKVFPLLYLFWMENVFIGFFNVLKMFCVKPKEASSWLAKIFFIPFFTFHYGMFTAVHGVFLIGMFGPNSGGRFDFPTPKGMWKLIGQYELGIVVLALVLSHLFSFIANYLVKKENEKTTLPSLMMKPYGRVVILHITIIFGGVLVKVLNSPLLGLLLLIVLKIFIDLFSHFREHQKLKSNKLSDNQYPFPSLRKRRP